VFFFFFFWTEKMFISRQNRYIPYQQV